MNISAKPLSGKTLAPIHPNEGVMAAYRKKLDALILAMHRSVMFWLSAAYRANQPEMAGDELDFKESEKLRIQTVLAKAIARNGTPANVINEVVQRLSKHWEKKFYDAAPELARYFSLAMADRADSALMAILKKSGWAVEFKMTAEVRDVLQASIHQNVSLIKSIHETYFSQVEGAVMRSVAAGRDLHTLSKELGPLIDLDRIGKGRKPGESDSSLLARTQRRANFIARDQANKATASITRTRYQGLGIKTAIWMHSHGGKEPRKSHVAFSGKEYDIEKGAYLDGVWTWPGVEPNCRCVCKPVIPTREDYVKAQSKRSEAGVTA